MQRAVPEQKLGVNLRYHRQQRIHYIELTEGLPSSLAHRAGLKNYDRIISFNGINIQNGTEDQFYKRFDVERHLPVQLLVCSPATYQHYKSNNKLLHSDLPTIQRLKPVYAISSN
jgi:C-terminal processing protease CtpA/Prc